MSEHDAGWIGRSLQGERYFVEAKLGEGGMGVVYRALDRHLDTHVVIKVPLRAVVANPEFAARFQREIRSLVKLPHPHVVKMLDVGEHDGLPFAVMQYLSGGSLDDGRSKDEYGRPLGVPPESLRRWLVDVAAALDFVHSRGYVHRDVKPANILFDEVGHAYLSDFGVARVVAATEAEADHAKSLTGTGLVVGTPRYMAPELVMSTQYDGRVDQYALAVTVHELLAGRPPIDAATPAGILVQQTVAAPPSLTGLNAAVRPALAQAVLRALAKNPADRYPTCAAFAADVVAALDGRTPPSGEFVAEARLSESYSGEAFTTAPAAQGAATPGAARSVVGRVSKGEGGRIPCPICASPLKLTPVAAGRSAPCPKCGGTILVSGDLTTITEIPPAATPAETDTRRAPSAATPPSTRSVYRIGERPSGTPAPAASSASSTAPSTAEASVADAPAGNVSGANVSAATPVDTAAPGDTAASSRRLSWTAVAAVVVLGGVAIGAALSWRASAVAPDVEPIADRRVRRGDEFRQSIHVRNLMQVARPLKFNAVGVLPPGFELDAASGDCRWTPDAQCPLSEFPLEVHVVPADAAAAPGVVRFTLTVYRDYRPPEVKYTAVPAAAVVGERVRVDFTVTDPENDPPHVEYQLEGPGGAGEWSEIAARAVAFDAVAPGDYRIRVRSRDAFSDPTVTEHRVSVRAKPAPAAAPVATSTAAASPTMPIRSTFAPPVRTAPSATSTSPFGGDASNDPTLQGKTFDEWMRQFRDNAYNYYYRRSDLDEEREALHALVDLCRQHSACRKRLLGLIRVECESLAAAGTSGRIEFELEPTRYFTAAGEAYAPRAFDTHLPVQGHADAVRAIYHDLVRVDDDTKGERTGFSAITRKDRVYLSILDLVGPPALGDLVAATDERALRAPALLSLSRLGDPALGSLVGLFRSPEPEVRFGAVWAVATILKDRTPDAATAAALRELLDDSNAAVEGAAVRVLVRTDLPPDVKATLAAKLLKQWGQASGDASRAYAFQTAVKLGANAAQVVAATETLLRGKGMPTGGEFAQAALFAPEGTKLCESIVERGVSPAGTVVPIETRLEAFEGVHHLAYAKRCPSALVAALGKALLDPETRVFNRALQRLRDLGGEARPAATYVDQFLAAGRFDSTQKLVCDGILRNIATGSAPKAPAGGTVPLLTPGATGAPPAEPPNTPPTGSSKLKLK